MIGNSRARHAVLPRGFAEPLDIDSDAIDAGRIAALCQAWISGDQSEAKVVAKAGHWNGLENVRNPARTGAYSEIVRLLVIVDPIDEIDVARGSAALVAQSMPDPRRHDHQHGPHCADTDDFGCAL